MDQLLQRAVNNHIANSATYLEKLIVPLVLDMDLENVRQIRHLHHPISVIDSVPTAQLDTLAASIATISRLNTMQAHSSWWHWALVYTLLRISTVHDPQHSMRIGRRNAASASMVAQDIDSTIESLKFPQLEAMIGDLQIVNSPRNQQYWDHVLYLAQSRAAFLKLDYLFGLLKPQEAHVDQFDLDPDQFHYNPVEKIKSNLPDNELLFDSGNADPQYAARAVIGQAPNYQDKTAVVHDEPWLNSSVKGYRFTIYYREIHGSDIPSYKISRNSDGTAHIVFSAPNYPNLTFNILDKPWDKSRYADIRLVNTYERGTVELQFGFK